MNFTNWQCFWWVEREAVLCAELMLVAILVKYESARNLKDLPPTQRCEDSVYS